MSLYDELKALAPHLSPSHRVSGSEVGDVLSALITFVEHGNPVLAAASEGAQALYDFYHDVEVARAKEAGDPEPVKGQPIQAQPAPGRYGPPPVVSRADFDRLAKLVESLVTTIAGAGTAGTAQAPEPPSPGPAEPEHDLTGAE